MSLCTARLVLRAWEDADAPALFSLASDPAIGTAAGWPPHACEAESLHIIQTVLRSAEGYAITLRDGTLVGAIGLKDGSQSNLVIGPTEYEAGYWIGKQFWGQGYAPEALRALIDHARADLACTVIWASHYLGNHQSHRVMEKCGLAPVRVDNGEQIMSLAL